MTISMDIDDFSNIREILSWDETNRLSTFELSAKLVASQELARKHELYYYLLRNSFSFIVEENDNLKDVAAQEKELFHSLAAAAFRLLEDNYLENNTPYWIENIYDDIFRYSNDLQLMDIIRNTTINLKTIETVGITINKKGAINFSLLTKSFLKNYLSALLTIIEQWNPDSQEANDKNIFDLLFPYYLHYCDPVNVRLTTLPRVRFNDMEIYSKAKRLAHYQSMFLLLHEVSHYGLNHIGNEVLQPNIMLDGFDELFAQKENYKEYEADAAAMLALQDFPDDQLDFIYLAVHCLFSFYSTFLSFFSIIRNEPAAAENVFTKRYDVICKIPGRIRASEYSHGLGATVSVILKRFIDILSSMKEEELNNRIEYYTATNPVQQKFTSTFKD
jgi:hypothetical protein